MNEIIKLEKLNNYCTLSKTNLTFNKDVTKEEWLNIFTSLKTIEGCVQFWIGDCLSYREQKWGMYEDVENLGYEKKTLKNIKYVSQRVESSLRKDDLSFTHHQEVAKLDKDKQKEYLDKASKEKLSVRELREIVRKDGVKYDEVKFPEGKYQVIYADPPWSYGNSMPSYVTTPTNYYPQMSIDDICNLPVKDITDDNAVLFLWTTSPLLEDSFKVINSWGFKYKTSFIWDKVKHNVGYYSSVRHEILLLAIKGSYSKQTPELEDSVYSEERTEHSKKPEYYYGLIERMYPNSNKIELFSREKRKGWTSYGNQIQ